MTSEVIKNRLGKLLALAASPNENEAALAMEKARELMQKYNIRECDVDLETKSANISHFNVPGYTKKIVHWEVELAAGIARCFDGKVFKRKTSDGWSIEFFAAKTEAEIIKDLFTRLRRTVSKLSKAYTEAKNGTETTRHNYAYGMIEQIFWRLKKIYDAISPEDMAVVLVKETEIDKMVGSMFTVTPEKNSTIHIRDAHAYYQGMEDAAHINLSKMGAGKHITGGSHENQQNIE